MSRYFLVALFIATLSTTTALSHPKPEPHICGIDPDLVQPYRGYGTMNNIYDRGEYYFYAERNGDTTTHLRIYKKGCSVSAIELSHSDRDGAVVRTLAGTIIRNYVIYNNGHYVRAQQTVSTDPEGTVTVQQQTESRWTNNAWVDSTQVDYLAGTATDVSTGVTFSIGGAAMTDPSADSGGYTHVSTEKIDAEGNSSTVYHNDYPISGM